MWGHGLSFNLLGKMVPLVWANFGLYKKKPNLEVQTLAMANCYTCTQTSIQLWKKLTNTSTISNVWSKRIYVTWIKQNEFGKKYKPCELVDAFGNVSELSNGCKCFRGPPGVCFDLCLVLKYAGDWNSNLTNLVCFFAKLSGVPQALCPCPDAC